MPDSELGGALDFRVWVTRGTYFGLAEGLERKARYSNGSIAFLSLYVVCGSIFQTIVGNDLSHTRLLAISIITIFVSIFILMVSLLENGKQYSLRAEHALATAHRLEKLYNLMRSKTPPSDEEARESYSGILAGAHCTRRKLDYVSFQLANREEFKFGWFAWSGFQVARAWLAIMEYGMYGAMLGLPPTAALFAYIYIK